MTIIFILLLVLNIIIGTLTMHLATCEGIKFTWLAVSILNIIQGGLCIGKIVGALNG